MNLRIKALAGVIAFLVSALALAQPGPGGKRPSLDDRVARMTEELDLSEEQAAEVRQVLKEARASRPNVRMMNPEEARPSLCKHMLATNAAIREVLNDEQAAEYEVFKESRRAGMGGGRGRGPADCSEFEES